jgi:hypothetical protein
MDLIQQHQQAIRASLLGQQRNETPNACEGKKEEKEETEIVSEEPTGHTARRMQCASGAKVVRLYYSGPMKALLMLYYAGSIKALLRLSSAEAVRAGSGGGGGQSRGGCARPLPCD